MDFKNAEELLMLCEKNHCSISEVMKQREMELGETSAEAVEKKMANALNIMRESAYTPIRRPQRSIGGLIGGEAKLLRKHKNAGKDICGGVLSNAITYAMAVLEVNTSMGLIVAAPTAGSSGIVPGLLLALQEGYHISEECRSHLISGYAKCHSGRCSRRLSGGSRGCFCHGSISRS